DVERPAEKLLRGQAARSSRVSTGQLRDPGRRFESRPDRGEQRPREPRRGPPIDREDAFARADHASPPGASGSGTTIGIVIVAPGMPGSIAAFPVRGHQDNVASGFPAAIFTWEMLRVPLTSRVMNGADASSPAGAKRCTVGIP